MGRKGKQYTKRSRRRKLNRKLYSFSPFQRVKKNQNQKKFRFRADRTRGTDWSKALEPRSTRNIKGLSCAVKGHQYQIISKKRRESDKEMGE